jgi:hypothetical protein
VTQTINPEKLKAAAEHLEWVLSQYPDEPVVQELAAALAPLIESAKAFGILSPIERIAGGHAFGDGQYRPFAAPNIDNAYATFAIEISGGLSDNDLARLERLSKLRAARET